MTSTYTANNGIEKIATGDQSGTWGETTNTNFDIIDRALNGVGSITLSGTSHTLTTTDGSLTEGMFKVLSLAGSPTGTNTITISPNDQDKLYFVKNASGQSAVFSQGTGANVTIPNGNADIIFADGAGSGAAVSSLFASSVNFGDNVTLNSDDAVLGFGADTDVTITHDPDDGLFFKSTATGDDNPFVLTIQTGETDIAADDKLGVINFQAPDEGTGTDAILVAAGIEAISEGDFAADSNATSLAFKTASSAAADEKVRIDSSGRMQIGTTSATNNALLTIKDSGSANPMARVTFDSGNSNVSNGVSVGYTAATFQPDFEIANGDAGIIRFSTNDTEALRIDTSQRVNINTTASISSFPLHVGNSSGNVQVLLSAGTNFNSTIGFADPADLTALAAGSATEATGQIVYAHNGDQLRFHTNGTQQMTIDSSGAVGIGTAPAGGTALDVRNDGVIQVVSTDTVQLIASNGGSQLKNVSNNVFLFGTNNTERMRIDADGRVGIDTTTTTRAVLNIDTDGTNTATGYGIALTNTAGGGGTWTLQCGDQAVDNGAFTIRDTGISGTTRLKITAAGIFVVPGVYNTTISSAANVFVGSSGILYRSTSSRRYKNSIENATHGLTELLALRPVTYKGNNDDDGNTVFGGLIAEEVHDAGLTEFVQYNDDDEPDALAYGNMVSLCIKAIQEQQETIKKLEARIAALEA